MLFLAEGFDPVCAQYNSYKANLKVNYKNNHLLWGIMNVCVCVCAVSESEKGA